MKKIFQIYAVCLFYIPALVPLFGQTITINKCLVGNTNQFPSGQPFSYQINIVVNGGDANDLEIFDQLPANLGIDPNNIINPPITFVYFGNTVTTTPIVTVTGGTTGGCNSAYKFGALVKWKFTVPIPSGVTFSRQISVKGREGETYECEQMNRSYARASNILCQPIPNGGLIPRTFLSNSILVKIIASSCWTAKKEVVGFIGVNVVRYKIIINNSGTIGCYNLYNPTIRDIIPTNAYIYGVSVPTGSTLSPLLNSSGIITFTPARFDVCANWPQEMYVDVAYPCPQFPAGTKVENCIQLQGESPEDCNKGQSPYQECFTQVCTGSSFDPTIIGCLKNWVGTGIGGCVYNYPVTNTAFVSYPGQQPNDTLCASVIIPATYATELSIDKYEPDPNTNHFQGCQGTYCIKITNSGNTPATNISVVDNFPGTLLNLLSAPTFTPGAFSPSITYSPSCSTFPCNPNTITFNANGFILYPGYSITICMNYEIRATILGTTVPVNIGDLVKNCATVNYTGTFGPLIPLCAPIPPLGSGSQTDCVSFNVEGPKPKPSICKSVEGGTNYLPKDPVIYRVCISNHGGAAMTGVLSDLTDPHLLDPANPPIFEYYYSSSGVCCPTTGSGVFSPILPPVIGAPTINYTTNTITWTGVNLPAQCQINKCAVLCIRIKTWVKDFTPSGTYPNCATFTPPVGVGVPISSCQDITVAQLYAIQSGKTAKGDLDVDYNTPHVGYISPLYGTGTPSGTLGSTVKFRIYVRNYGTVPVNDVVVSDVLDPQFSTFIVGSTKAYKCLNAAITGTVPPFLCGSPTQLTLTSVNYLNTLPVPLTCLTQTGCTTGACTFIPVAASKIVKINFGPGVVLQPGDMIWVDLEATILANTPPNATPCNKSYVRVCNQIDNTASQVSNGQVCVQIKPYVPNCCPQNVVLSVDTTSTTLTPQGTNMLLTAGFNISATPFPIQEVRVTIVDKDIIYTPDAACVQCYTPYKYLGTFQKAPPPQAAVGSLNLTPSLGYVVINKEIVYKPGTPFIFSVPLALNISILLPDLNNIPCCEVRGKICLKFVFKDVNCNYCEKIVCLPVSYFGQ